MVKNRRRWGAAVAVSLAHSSALAIRSRSFLGSGFSTWRRRIIQHQFEPVTLGDIKHMGEGSMVMVHRLDGRRDRAIRALPSAPWTHRLPEQLLTLRARHHRIAHPLRPIRRHILRGNRQQETIPEVVHEMPDLQLPICIGGQLADFLKAQIGLGPFTKRHRLRPFSRWAQHLPGKSFVLITASWSFALRWLRDPTFQRFSFPAPGGASRRCFPSSKHAELDIVTILSPCQPHAMPLPS